MSGEGKRHGQLWHVHHGDREPPSDWGRSETQRLRDHIREALNELGVPNDEYPAPVANAVDILNAALHPAKERR